MPYDYTSAQIRDRVKSGTDAKRAATADQLAMQATQPPHEDDAAALAHLRQLSGDDSTGGWATNDARNYGRMVLEGITGQPAQYSEARDGGGFVGSLGSALKFAAPFAGLIPGVGPLLGAGLSAGGSALGGALSGDKFDLAKTLMAGGAGYLGGQANPLGGGNAATDMVSKGFISAPSTLGGAPGAAMTQAATGGGGILDKVLGAYKTPTGGIDFEKILGTVGTIGGGIQAAHMQDQANDQREAAVAGATNDWNARQPLRDAAQQRLLAPPAARPDLTASFADLGNPWYRKPVVPAGGF